jgi:carboxyl-terminal processing protease
MEIKITFKKMLLLPIMAGLFLTGCKEEETPLQRDEPEPTNEFTSINNWIQEEMEIYYYWLENMRTPISPNSEPDAYYEALLNRPTDRFSAIFENARELTDGLGGVSQEAGYEFNLYRVSSENDQVIAEVSYIKKGSPAQGKDIRRGDIITAINGTGFTLDNYRGLIRDMRSPHTITYRRPNANNGLDPLPDLEMEVATVSENPNFMDTVYTIDNQKIGYVVYHFFAPSPNPQQNRDNPIYDNEMDEIFQKFQAEGINNLIVDFRYNGGGYVSSAVNLASLIGSGVSSSDVFSKTRYNSFLMSFDELKDVQTRFKDKSQNIGNQLAGTRVYVLTSRRTASASELIINSLRPYMDVVVIGDQTTGKNVGSIVIEEEDNPANNWALLPTVSKSFNSLDQSEYGEGFIPDVEVVESSERLRPFGDVNELLLRTAIQQITGTPPSGRFEKLDRRDVGSTLDLKIRSGVMIEQLDKVPRK